MVAAAPGRVAADRIASGDLNGPSGVKTLLSNPQFWLRCAEIGFLNLLLSGDNAVVIALRMKRQMPVMEREQGRAMADRHNGRARKPIQQ